MTNPAPPDGPEGEGPAVNEIDRGTLMRYLDGEMPPAERREVEAAIERSAELRRELTIYRALHEDMSMISFAREATRDSIWGRVSKRLARPIGWYLVGTGVVAWAIHMVYLYFTSAAAQWEKLATTAVVIGVLLLFASVIHERYRELLTDPYRNVKR